MSCTLIRSEGKIDETKLGVIGASEVKFGPGREWKVFSTKRTSTFAQAQAIYKPKIVVNLSLSGVIYRIINCSLALTTLLLFVISVTSSWWQDERFISISRGAKSMNLRKHGEKKAKMKCSTYILAIYEYLQRYIIKVYFS